MKGVILAGGLGMRLRPLNGTVNKTLLPVYDKPLIMHAIDTLVTGGITNIAVLMNMVNPGLFMERLGDGSAMGCHLTYHYDHDRNGPGRSLLLARDFVGNEEFVLTLGDSIFFTPLVFHGKPAPHMFVMPLDGFDDPGKYGQVKLAADGLVIENMVWKPAEIYSNLIQTTAFVLPSDAFERLEVMSAERAGSELHISDLTLHYVAENRMTATELAPRSYIDCGDPIALLRAGCRRFEQVHGCSIDRFSSGPPRQLELLTNQQ